MESSVAEVFLPHLRAIWLARPMMCASHLTFAKMSLKFHYRLEDHRFRCEVHRTSLRALHSICAFQCVRRARLCSRCILDVTRTLHLPILMCLLTRTRDFVFPSVFGECTCLSAHSRSRAASADWQLESLSGAGRQPLVCVNGECFPRVT